LRSFCVYWTQALISTPLSLVLRYNYCPFSPLLSTYGTLHIIIDLYKRCINCDVIRDVKTFAPYCNYNNTYTRTHTHARTHAHTHTHTIIFGLKSRHGLWIPSYEELFSKFMECRWFYWGARFVPEIMHDREHVFFLQQ
jgi:hypothetical protein